MRGILDQVKTDPEHEQYVMVKYRRKLFGSKLPLSEQALWKCYCSDNKEILVLNL